MTTLLTTELIERCHAGAKSKGFWDVTPPQGQQLMLVISELAEALEAHRKGRKPPIMVANHVEHMQAQMGNPADASRKFFENEIKDTVGDELADAYIRLCDFIGGFGLDKQTLLASPSANMALPENFGAALLKITGWIIAAEENDLAKEWYLADALTDIKALCEREGIDLATHIDLKLRYNATRPLLHAKAY